MTEAREAVIPPRLVVVAARAVFTGDKPWLDAIARVADALATASSRDVVIQVRLEDQAMATDERAAAALARIRGLAPQLRVLLNAPGLVDAELGFDGVHWREATIPSVRTASRFATASIHSQAALRRAENAGAAAVLYGPVWSPTWKPSQPVGLDALGAIVRAARIPVLAIGGMTPARVTECLVAGAHGVAVASGLLLAEDVDFALTEYVAALEERPCG